MKGCLHTILRVINKSHFPIKLKAGTISSFCRPDQLDGLHHCLVLALSSSGENFLDQIVLSDLMGFHILVFAFCTPSLWKEPTDFQSAHRVYVRPSPQLRNELICLNEMGLGPLSSALQTYFLFLV